MYMYSMLTLLLQFGFLCVGVALSHSGLDCPPLNVTDSHSSLEDFAVQGSNHTFFQVFCSQPDTARLTGHWKYDSGPLNFTRHNSTNVSYTEHGSICTNFSLQLINVSFAASDGDYNITVSSDCGSHAIRTFSLSVNGCVCDNPPKPHLHYHVAAFKATSATPTNLSLLTAQFRGCTDSTQYDAVVRVNDSDTAVCADGRVLRGNYNCTREYKYQCLFVEEVTAVAYDQSNSGQYCIQSLPLGGGNGSNSTCFHTQVLPWPTVSGPLNNVTTSLTGGTLTWRVNNFHPATLVTAYKDITQAVEIRTENISGTDAFVFIDVPRLTSGQYLLYIIFNASVDIEGTGFQPVESHPGYAYHSEIVAAVVILPIAFVLGCPVCLASYGLYKCCTRWKRRQKDENKEHLLKIQDGASKTSNYGSGMSMASGDIRETTGVDIQGGASRTTDYGSGVLSNPTENDGSPPTTDTAIPQSSPASCQTSGKVQQLVLCFREEILTSVKPAALLPCLQRRDLVTPEESESITSSSTNHRRTELIIQALPSKGEDVIERFAAALSEESQHPPHQRLAKTLTKALKGSPPTSPTASLSVREVIYPHMPEIVSQANPLILLPHLLKHELVINDDVDYIRATKTDSDRTQHIISELFRCGERAVEKFIRCLIEENTHPSHQELAELLIRKLLQYEEHRKLADTLKRDLEEARSKDKRQGSGESAGQGSGESAGQGSGESTGQGSGESAGQRSGDMEKNS